MVKRHLVLAGAAVLTVTLLPGVATAGDTSGEASWEVIAEGLNNPRGVHVRANGAVLVAEAGLGGDTGICVADPEDPEAEVCLGLTGSITRVRQGSSKRVVEGLPSFAAADGSAAIGPSDVLRRFGRTYATVGLGGDPSAIPGFGSDGELLASLLKMKPHRGVVRQVADIGEYEIAANPDGGPLDTNPNSVTTRRGKLYVSDAGGNALLEVKKGGAVSTVAVFPVQFVDAPPFLGLPPGTQIPMDAVPTSVVVGPDRALYVGQLTGFPFPVGGAAVWRVVPGHEPEVFADGFTNIIDIDFGPDGRLYVLEIATNSLLGDPGGALWAVDHDGSRHLLLSEPLFFPGGMDVSRSGDVYVSNCGVCPRVGELLKVSL
jgi:hypothetical protein